MNGTQQVAAPCHDENAALAQEWFSASEPSIDAMTDRLVEQRGQSNERDREDIAGELWRYLDFGLFFGGYVSLDVADTIETLHAIGDDDPFPTEPGNAMEVRCARVLAGQDQAARQAPSGCGRDVPAIPTGGTDIRDMTTRPPRSEHHQ